MKTKLFLFSALIFTFFVTGIFHSTFAQTEEYKMFDDVEALLDDYRDFLGTKAGVPGEVEYRIDPNTFVLESGGIINDEIVVFMPGSLPEDQIPLVVDDAELVVKGVLKEFKVIEIERETGWDLTPEIEAELENVTVVLVADEITGK